MKLEDQIEWDIDSPDPAPEYFADVYAKELGLNGEFRYVGLNHLLSLVISEFCLGLPLRILFENKSKHIKSHCSSSDTPLTVRQCRMTIFACLCYLR